MTKMTPTQGRYLSYIKAYTEGFGLPLAESEIAKAMGVSAPSVHQMIVTLGRKGFIRRQPGAARSIEILASADAIPQWKGKRLVRKVRMWVQTGPGTEPHSPVGDGEAIAYRFKISLVEIHPEIWRRIETLDITLGKLHELIQTAMGWTNSHMHQFEIGDKQYTDPRFMMGEIDNGNAMDYTSIRISDLVAKHGSKLRLDYEYDFGDRWRHEVILEKVTQSELGGKYPRCIAGERACPPEDIGGVWGFEDYVEAITDTNHSEYREFLDWYGPFEPTYFDAEDAIQRMKKGLPSW